jgi:WD40 repeat protein
LLLSPTRVQGVLLRSDCNALGTVGEAGGTLFDAMSGAILAESSIEPGDTRQLYNIGDGIGIASADTDEAIRLWGFARTGESEPLWRGPDRDARSISPDGGWAATMIGNVVTLTELASGESRSIALGSAQEGATLSDTAEDILVGPNGRTLLWRAFDGSARLMDTISGAELARFADAPALRAFGMTETALAAAGTDGVIRLWSTADPNGIDVSHPMTIALPVGDVRALGLSQDVTVLATSSKDGVQVWRLQGTGSAAKLTIPVAAQALALNHDGSRVAMMHANPDGSLLPIPLTVWDTSTGQQVAEMSVARALPAMAFSGGEGEDLIVAQGGEGVITVGRYFITVEELARRAAQVAGCRLVTDLERPAELTDAETARRLSSLDRPECEALLLRRLRERQRLGAN